MIARSTRRVLWEFAGLLVVFVLFVIASFNLDRRTTTPFAPENSHTTRGVDLVSEIPAKYAQVIEKIENPDDEIGRLLKQVTSQQSTPAAGGDWPGAPPPLFMALRFEEVDDLDAFVDAYLLFKRGQQRTRLEEEGKTRLKYLEEKSIRPGGRYDISEYTEYFNYVLDTVEVLAELGNAEKAVELSNEVLWLCEISGSEGEPAETSAMKLGLRSDAQWRIGSTLGHDPFLLASLATGERARDVAAEIPNDEAVLGFDRIIGERRYHLVESGLLPGSKLEAVRKTLGRVERNGKSNVSSLTIYIKTLRKLGRYAEAREALRRLPELHRIEGRTVSSLDWADVAQILTLDRLGSAKSFRDAFGPFAPSLFAECREMCVDEAWEQVLNEAFAGPAETYVSGDAVLFGNFVIYESQQGPYARADQFEIAMHELVHRGVQSGQTMRSGEQWLRVCRDVPTAALHTYMALIAKTQSEDVLLPPSLEFFVNHGRQSARSEQDRIHEYIAATLEYFDAHGLETNAAYECAAILAGALLEIIGKPESKEMTSYISHLKLVSHKEALLRASEGIEPQL